MNAVKSLFVATAVVTGLANVPLFAQAKPAVKSEHYQVEGQITRIDQSTGEMTIEAEKIPGHEGAKLTLSYKVSHPTALQMFKSGEKVSVDLITTDKGPVVQSIASLPETQQLGMVTDTSSRDRGPADTTCIDACAGISDQTSVTAQPGMQRDSVSSRVDVQANPDAPAPVSGGVPNQRLPFTGKVTAVKAEGREITIATDSVAGTPTGPLSLPYNIPDSIAISAFHEGDWVHGEMVIAGSVTTIENVKLGKGTPEPRTDSPKPSEAPKDGSKKY